MSVINCVLRLHFGIRLVILSGPPSCGLARSQSVRSMRTEKRNILSCREQSSGFLGEWGGRKRRNWRCDAPVATCRSSAANGDWLRVHRTDALSGCCSAASVRRFRCPASPTSRHHPAPCRRRVFQGGLLSSLWHNGTQFCTGGSAFVSGWWI